MFGDEFELTLDGNEVDYIEETYADYSYIFSEDSHWGEPRDPRLFSWGQKQNEIAEAIRGNKYLVQLATHMKQYLREVAQNKIHDSEVREVLIKWSYSKVFYLDARLVSQWLSISRPKAREVMQRIAELFKCKASSPVKRGRGARYIISIFELICTL